MLVYNTGRLLELDGGQLYLNTIVWREEWVILFVLIIYIHGLDGNARQQKVLRRLKFLFYVASLGCVAKYRQSVGCEKVIDNSAA